MAGKQSAQLERKKFFAGLNDRCPSGFSGAVYPVSAVNAVSGQLLCRGNHYTGCI